LLKNPVSKLQIFTFEVEWPALQFSSCLEWSGGCLFLSVTVTVAVANPIQSSKSGFCHWGRAGPEGMLALSKMSSLVGKG
jgi:hypothetical protein